MVSEDKYWRTQLLSATPKGAFLISLLDAGLIDDIFNEKANDAWTAFKHTANKYGYFPNKEDDEFMRKLP